MIRQGSKTVGQALGGMLGSAMKGTAKATAKGAVNVGVGTAKLAGAGATGIGKATGHFGKRVIGEAISNPATLATAVGGAAAVGFGLAEADKRNDGLAVAGKAAIGMTAASAIPGAAAIGTVGAVGMASAGTGILGLTAAIGRNAIKMPTEPLSFSNMGDLKFSGLGVGMLVGGSVLEGTKRAINKYEQIRMGKHDGQMRKATPVIPQVDRSPSYANNGGATGDLVFSMYNNR
jgi:hypothetical protein